MMTDFIITPTPEKVDAVLQDQIAPIRYTII